MSLSFAIGGVVGIWIGWVIGYLDKRANVERRARYVCPRCNYPEKPPREPPEMPTVRLA